MLKITLVALVALVSGLMVALTRRRAALQEARGGCLSCGATDLEVRGDERLCRRCGYVGRADGGGKLTAAELDALHHPD